MEPVQETERVQTLGEHKHNVTQREQPMEGLRADLRSGTALRSKRKQSSCRRREVCVRVCVRACLRVCMRACVRACVGWVGGLGGDCTCLVLPDR